MESALGLPKQGLSGGGWRHTQALRALTEQLRKQGWPYPRVPGTAGACSGGGGGGKEMRRQVPGQGVPDLCPQLTPGGPWQSGMEQAVGTVPGKLLEMAAVGLEAMLKGRALLRVPVTGLGQEWDPQLPVQEHWAVLGGVGEQGLW